MKLRIVDDQSFARGIVDMAKGSHGAMRGLEKCPVAVAERAKVPTRGVDHVFLCKHDGTRYYQWAARKSDGHMHRFGRIMEIDRS